MTDVVPSSSRRRFLKTSGTALALIPVANLIGCSDDEGRDATPDEAPPMDTPATEPADTAPQPQPSPATEAPPAEAAQQDAEPGAAGGELVKIEVDEPSAQALGYVHDATEVDTSAYPRYEDGQTCSNCSLYLADAGDEEGWGGCSIFPGKLVKAEGWCNAYVAAS